MPGEVHYSPGGGDRVSATGDPGLLSHLRVHNHKIDLDCSGSWHDEKLNVTLPGREFRKFTVAGSGKLFLDLAKHDIESFSGTHRKLHSEYHAAIVDDRLEDAKKLAANDRVGAGGDGLHQFERTDAVTVLILIPRHECYVQFAQTLGHERR